MAEPGHGFGNDHNGDHQQLENLHIPQFIACTAIGFEPFAVLPEELSQYHVNLFMSSLFQRQDESEADWLCRAARLWEDVLLPVCRVPFFLVRVADMRVYYGSRETALQLYMEAMEYVNQHGMFDEDYAEWITEQMTLCNQEARERTEEWEWSPKFDYPWRAVRDFVEPQKEYEPRDLQEIKARWSRIRQDPDKNERYMRYHCIETNILEQSFALEEQSIQHLFRRGYDIRHVLPLHYSRLKDRELIVDVLNDTEEALQKAISQEDLRKFSVEWILRLHATCLRSSKVTPERYINIGVTRGVTKKNVYMQNTKTSIEFCPYQCVNSEMAAFVAMSREYLRRFSDCPLALSAWMHIVFVTCHPFEDGNGRLTRILSSIPLVRAGLPPICVSSSRREQYFTVLNETRLSNDYNNLIGFLKMCMLETLRKVEE